MARRNGTRRVLRLGRYSSAPRLLSRVLREVLGPIGLRRPGFHSYKERVGVLVGDEAGKTQHAAAVGGRRVCADFANEMAHQPFGLLDTEALDFPYDLPMIGRCVQ